MSKPYIVHKAVELDKVKKKLVPTEDQLRTEYLAQPKYDGCNCVAIKYANSAEHIKLFSRTGEEVLSADHIKEALAAAPFAPIGVYLGEYWHPHIDQPTVSGMFRKQDGTQYTDPMLVVFDFVSIGEWEQGFSPLTYLDRVGRLPATLSKIEECRGPFFLAESQGFLVDQELGTMEAARLLSEGGAYDGLILRKPSGTWTKGDKGTNGEVIKIKPTLTLDLRVLRINEDVGEKTGRPVYTVVVDLGGGKEQEVGSGVPWEWAKVPFIGHIVEIEAMSFSKYGLLREPRFKSIRHDKTEADR
ncbi:ATP dependent DNA lygase [Xanthomonas phage XAJ24]|uniref:ATP dependent DNA lygase n=1 Tax=Xanthomonas phage XAJ24 TaxID=1775250 RepID=A0A1I9L2A2_9CAUD|nr:ATP dependent DNA lygase [Xanthomonas phage XAJ24]AMW36089.1 ATP dependent DNA lygase [Xanthomonas phage XAJ24]